MIAQHLSVIRSKHHNRIIRQHATTHQTRNLVIDMLDTPVITRARRLHHRRIQTQPPALRLQSPHRTVKNPRPVSHIRLGQIHRHILIKIMCRRRNRLVRMDKINRQKPRLISPLRIDKLQPLLRTPVRKMQMLIQMPWTPWKTIAIHPMRIRSPVPRRAILAHILLIIIINPGNRTIRPFRRIKPQLPRRRTPMGLARKMGAIPRIAQNPGQSRPGQRRRCILKRAVIARLAPRNHRTASRHTHRTSRISVAKTHPRRSHIVQIGRLQHGMALNTEAIAALLIRHNK